MFSTVVSICAGMVSIATFIALITKVFSPIRQLGDGLRCLLRAEMLKTYYRHKDEKMIRQFEYENFLFLYAAYKTLGGNSFIDDIEKEVRSWSIES